MSGYKTGRNNPGIDDHQNGDFYTVYINSPNQVVLQNDINPTNFAPPAVGTRAGYRAGGQGIGIMGINMPGSEGPFITPGPGITRHPLGYDTVAHQKFPFAVDHVNTTFVADYVHSGPPQAGPSPFFRGTLADGQFHASSISTDTDGYVFGGGDILGNQHPGSERYGAGAYITDLGHAKAYFKAPFIMDGYTTTGSGIGGFLEAPYTPTPGTQRNLDYFHYLPGVSSAPFSPLIPHPTTSPDEGITGKKIQRTKFASDDVGTLPQELVTSRFAGGGVSFSPYIGHGYIIGGLSINPFSGNALNSIEKFSYASETSSTASDSLGVAVYGDTGRFHMQTVNSQTKGYSINGYSILAQHPHTVAGGSYLQLPSRSVERIDSASDTVSTVSTFTNPADEDAYRNIGRAIGVGISSIDYGYMAGGTTIANMQTSSGPVAHPGFDPVGNPIVGAPTSGVWLNPSDPAYPEIYMPTASPEDDTDYPLPGSPPYTDPANIPGFFATSPPIFLGAPAGDGTTGQSDNPRGSIWKFGYGVTLHRNHTTQQSIGFGGVYVGGVSKVGGSPIDGVNNSNINWKQKGKLFDSSAPFFEPTQPQNYPSAPTNPQIPSSLGTILNTQSAVIAAGHANGSVYVAKITNSGISMPTTVSTHVGAGHLPSTHPDFVGPGAIGYGPKTQGGLISNWYARSSAMYDNNPNPFSANAECPYFFDNDGVSAIGANPNYVKIWETCFGIEKFPFAVENAPASDIVEFADHGFYDIHPGLSNPEAAMKRINNYKSVQGANYEVTYSALEGTASSTHAPFRLGVSGHSSASYGYISGGTGYVVSTIPAHKETDDPAYAPTSGIVPFVDLKGSERSATGSIAELGYKHITRFPFAAGYGGNQTQFVGSLLDHSYGGVGYQD